MKMKNLPILLALLLASGLCAQEKGATPVVPSAPGPSPSATYAVVVGISDYQDPEIPDLRFADRDALAFSNFLRNSAGGSLDNKHLKVLINEQATAAQFAVALDWLLESAHEGDRVIIYFSGHGDLEKKTLSQPGFLLCWDAPAHVYMAGGTFALPMLEEVISTLSIQNKAKTLVITDACHSGALAGHSIGGPQATSAALARQFANETKILSCQPTEFSLEGEQWGGGRGVFSYYLVNGLYGLADANGDGYVSLMELGRYLEDRVGEDVSPQRQLPMITGNRADLLARVDSGLLAHVRKSMSDAPLTMAPIDNRGLEAEVLSRVDSSVQTLYAAFLEALKGKRFFEPADRSADAYFERLMAEPQLEPLYSAMRRRYAAALQDEAQQALNSRLKSNLSEIGLSRVRKLNKYRDYPRMLARAADLLGPQHYFYRTLKARQLFFEGYNCHLQEEENYNETIGNKALALLRESLNYQTDCPHIYYIMGLVYGFNLHQIDSARYYAVLAGELAPSWILPYTGLTDALVKQKQFDLALTFLAIADSLHPNSFLVDFALAKVYRNKGDYKTAEEILLQIIAEHPDFRWAYNSLGFIYESKGRIEEAQSNYLKAIALDSTWAIPYSNLGNIYVNQNKNAEAEKLYLKAIQADSGFVASYDNLAYLYITEHRFTEAEKYSDKSLAVDPSYDNAYYNRAVLRSFQHRFSEAFQYLEQAFQNGFNDYGVVSEDPDLEALHAFPEWFALLKRYFPEQTKN